MNFSPRGDVCNKNTENEAFLRSKPSPGCDFHPFHLSNCHTLNHHNFFHVLILGGPGEGDTPNKTRHFTSRSARLLCAAVLMTSHPSCLEIHNGFTFFQQHGFQDEHAIQCPKMSRRQHLSSRGQPKHSKGEDMMDYGKHSTFFWEFFLFTIIFGLQKFVIIMLISI